jgi:uncharacterized protein YcbX
MASVAALYRYPVKGLSAAPLAEVELAPGQALPWDRAFALAHGSTRFDPARPEYLPKRSFLQLMTDERLAALQTSFDPATGVLSIVRDGRQVARGSITQASGRMVIEQFFAAWMRQETRGQPRLVHSPGHVFSDVHAPVVSVINLASVKDLERVVGRPLDPLRFRANIYLDDLPAWSEFGWLGRSLAVGAAHLAVETRIDRCAATNVDPATCLRDVNIPGALQRGFGHGDFGVYARVTGGGMVRAGDPVSLQ